MSIAVEHEKRKQEILEKALDVFVEEGYEDTTFQKIAERCGITRTILYLYFKNKREIFSFSIKLFTARLEGEIRAIGSDRALSQADKLSKIAELAVDQCGKNRRLLAVVLDYLGHLRTSGGDPDERVRRRTIRMEVVERSVPRCELYAADEMFFSGTAMEVTAVVNVDRRQIGDGKAGPVCSKLKKVFEEMTKGRNPKYMEYLTKVE